MKLKIIDTELCICKLEDLREFDFNSEFFFIGRTDEEISIVCPSAQAPRHTMEKNDGWKGFRVQGTLDFSLTGILSALSAVLADADIGIFAVSTYQTDYILVKSQDHQRAAAALKNAGYELIP